MAEKKLYKTKDDAMLGGVLKGFSEVYNMDVSVVRILYVVLTLFVVGSPIILYLVLYLVLPDKQDVLKQNDPYDMTQDYYD